jgi:hypothetical protein
MKTITILIVLAITLTFYGCGDEAKEVKDTVDAIQKAGEAAKNMEDEMTAAEERLQQRRESGDTTSMHFTKLQEFLPASIDGYEAGEPKGETVQMGNFSMSQVNREYNADGKRIRLELMDYNEGYGMFRGMTAWAKTGYSREDSDGYERTFDTGFDHVAGYEKYNNKRKRGEVLYSIAWRFLLRIDGDGVDGTEYLQKIAGKVDIEKLSEM